jgi:hypothetical protein
LVAYSTKANWSTSAAIAEETEFPKWTITGCFGQSLNLLMNDFAKSKRFGGRGGVEKATGLFWLQRTVGRCNLIAIFIQESGGPRKWHFPFSSKVTLDISSYPHQLKNVFFVA